MKTPSLELRTGGAGAGQLRAHAAPDGGPRIGGLGIPFDQWSEDLGGFKERILRGAFLSSIENDDIRAIFNHNSDFVLGRKSAGTLRLHETMAGVEYEADAPNTQWARDLAESISRGDIRENSFGFNVPKGGDRWEERDGILWRTVKEAELRELGPQVFAAYPQTDVQVRSIEETVCHGRECVRSSRRDIRELEEDLNRRLRKRRGQDPNLLLLELELNLDIARRSRARTTQARTPADSSNPPRPNFSYLLAGRERRLIRAVATHECGHALLYHLAGAALNELRLDFEIQDDGQWHCVGGECVAATPNVPNRQRAVIDLAGAAAVELAGLSDAVPWYWSLDDRKHARSHGWYPTAGHETEAAETLRQHWAAVEALVSALLERGRIPGSEAEQIILDNLDPAARDRVRRAA